MTTWTTRTPTTNPIWNDRPVSQIDLWYLLTELSAILTEEEWKRIIFHNWEFYNWNTLWYDRENDEWNSVEENIWIKRN